MVTENEINHLQDVYNDAIAREPDYTGGYRKSHLVRNRISSKMASFGISQDYGLSNIISDAG